MHFSLQNNKKNHFGFTLLELLISLSILVFISLSIYQATTETYKLRDSLLKEGNFYNNIRFAIGILQQDIALLYSPMIFIPSQQSAKTDPTLLLGDLSKGDLFWSPAIDISGIRPSHFTGAENKMSFISNSHLRIYKNSTESCFSKITYELKSPTQPYEDTALEGTRTLVKIETPNAFAPESMKDTLRRSYELLHGIKKFSVTYYQKDGNTWKKTKTWDNEREETKNIYPDLIEINLEVVGSKQQNFEGIYKMRPELPLNGLYSKI